MTTEKVDVAEVDPHRDSHSSEDVPDSHVPPGGVGVDTVDGSAVERVGGIEGDSASLEVDSRESELGFQQVAPQFVAAERFAGWIVLGVLLGVALFAFTAWGVGLYATRSSLWLWGLWALGLSMGCVFLAVLGWLFYVWPEMEHRFLGWRMNELGLEIKKGVWWQHRITVPRDRIQHADVEQGPVMRRYGLAKLILHTAGTHAPTIELPGLTMAVAQELKSQLTDQAARSHG